MTCDGTKRLGTVALAATVAILVGLIAVPADAQSLAAGVKGSLPTPEVSGYGGVFLSPSWSMSLGVGVQSASTTVATWGTVYLAEARQPVVPYVGFGVRAVLTQPVQTHLMLLGGVQARLPALSPLRVSVEAAVLPRLPDLGRIPIQGRLIAGLRF
ncbi:MAG: hypothetical protein ABEL51_08120 [Salinibacter sp.]